MTFLKGSEKDFLKHLKKSENRIDLKGGIWIPKGKTITIKSGYAPYKLHCRSGQKIIYYTPQFFLKAMQRLV